MRAILVLLIVAVSCAPRPASSPPSLSPSSAPPSDIGAASPSPIVLPSSAQISAPSSNVVWTLVAGTRLFVSTDRGDTWEERRLPTSATGVVISFVSEREGWLASGDPTTPCAQNPRPLWRTEDGAHTWSEVGLSTVTAATCAASLSFMRGQHGFLAALDSRVGPVVYGTTDGAKTWLSSTAIPDPPDLPMQGGRPDMELGRVQAFGAELLLASKIRSASILPTQYVYRSRDGGASWTYLAAVPVTGALVFVTASRWLRIGPAAASVESTDAGATWHAYRSDYTQAAPVAPEVVFGDEQVGYATVRAEIQRTLDGGAHWARLVTPGTR